MQVLVGAGAGIAVQGVAGKDVAALLAIAGRLNSGADIATAVGVCNLGRHAVGALKAVAAAVEGAKDSGFVASGATDVAGCGAGFADDDLLAEGEGGGGG